jgi:DNA-binding beta-propeller fold protein YncE
VIDTKTDQAIATIPLDGKPELAASDDDGTIYVNLEDSSAVDVINPKTFQVVHKWSIAPGEEPTGLTIDQVTNRLFIGCGNKLMVVMDATNGKIITTLPIGEHCDGVDFDQQLQRAYSSNGDGTLTVVQERRGDKFEVLENVVTQKGARTLAVDGKTHHIYLPAAEFGDPPAATPENPHPRPVLKPGSFVVLDVETLRDRHH